MNNCKEQSSRRIEGSQVEKRKDIPDLTKKEQKKTLIYKKAKHLHQDLLNYLRSRNKLINFALIPMGKITLVFELFSSPTAIVTR